MINQLHVVMLSSSVFVWQGEEFNCYEKYVDDMLAPHGKERNLSIYCRERSGSVSGP